MTTSVSEPRPRDLCHYLLHAMDASEGRTRRRKRDQTPDMIGLGVKRDLLARVVAEDPSPDEFEEWLTAQVLAASAGGPVRAMAVEILHEYQLAQLQPHFGQWLAAGAPSDDAEPGSRRAAACGCPEDLPDPR
jgi:hypothetical protein